MEFIIFFVLILWLIALQNKVVKLSDNVEQLKKCAESYILKNLKNGKEQIFEQKQSEIQDIQKQVQFQNASGKEPENKNIHNNTEHKEIQKPQKENFDFQTIFLGNIFNKIGAIAIIISIIIFIKLVSSFIVITPAIKIFTGFLFGVCMIAGALLMHKKENLKNYSEVLLGTGFADLFITAFCGYTLFGLYNSVTTIVIGVLLLLATFIVADRMRTLSMLVIGLIGGYMTPFLSGAETPLIIGYLIFLNMISLIYTLKYKKHNYINIINLLITMLIMSTYIYGMSLNIGYPIVLWAIYLVYDLIREKGNSADNILSWINYGILTMFSIMLFKDAHIILGYMFGAVALVYAGLAMFSGRINNNVFKTYEYYVLLNIWFFVFYILTDIQSVISWSVIALVLSFMTLKENFSHLNKMVLGYYFTAITGIFLAKYDGAFCITAHYNPIVNIRALLFGIPIISMLISAHLHRKTDKGNLLNLCGISLIYLYFVGEINSILANKNNFSNLLMIYTTLAFVYSVQTKRLSITTKYAGFNAVSCLMTICGLFGLIIGAYFFKTDNYIVLLNMRGVAFLTAIITFILFAKWKKSKFYKYLAVTLGFLLCHTECTSITKIHEDMNYIISLGWVLYAGVITITGIIKNINFLKYSGIIISILAIFRIFIYDLAKVDMLYKLIISFVLGIILLLVSYLYSKRK